MKKYESYKSYTKIEKISKIKIELTLEQQEKIMSFYFYWGKLEKIIEDGPFKIDPSILLMGFIHREGQISSWMEGSKTQFEDLSYDIEKIDNSSSWETRNLINLYKKTLKEIDDNTFFLSKDTIRNMHKELYLKNINQFNITFDPKKIIEKIKPGKIVNNDDTPNWIGERNYDWTLDKNLENATLIPIKPSQKEEYLNDLCETIKNKMDNNKSFWNEIIALHPVFEAIHPFSDGNGRIGRLLLTLMFKMIFPKNKILINFSNIIYKNKNEYIKQLQNVQLNNDWKSWTEYFINLLIKVQKELNDKIKSMVKLWNEFCRNPNISKKPLRKEILKYFFKYYKLNKGYIIQKLISKKYSKATVYRAFEIVVKEINAISKTGQYYSLEKIKEIIVDEEDKFQLI